MSCFKFQRIAEAAARGASAGLAGMLLVFTLLAADASFHRELHHASKAGSAGCILCLFAKGQLNSAEPSPISVAPVWFSSEPAPPRPSTRLPEFHRLAFPSRAPPAPSSPLPAVA